MHNRVIVVVILIFKVSFHNDDFYSMIFIQKVSCIFSDNEFRILETEGDLICLYFHGNL